MSSAMEDYDRSDSGDKDYVDGNHSSIESDDEYTLSDNSTEEMNISNDQQTASSGLSRAALWSKDEPIEICVRPPNGSVGIRNSYFQKYFRESSSTYMHRCKIMQQIQEQRIVDSGTYCAISILTGRWISIY
jgi:hypothetical protein